MYIRVRYDILSEIEDSWDEGLIIEIKSSLKMADDAFFFFNIPAYEYNDCCDHRSEKHKTAEHSQSDYSSQVQFGLMGTARLLSAIHSEGTRRFRYACADSRLCVVHASRYLVVLWVIAAGVIHRRRSYGSI